MQKFIRVLATLSALLATVITAPRLHAQTAGKLKIGFSLESMKGERWQTDLESFQLRAKQLGAEVVSSDANGDDALQLRQVQDMIKSGVKVLVIFPHDTKTAAAMVDAAKSANVKVISYDRLILNSDVALYVSFDRTQIARMQAETLVKLAPKGNYVLIAGSPNDDGAKALHDEQMKVLRPYIDRGDIKIIADNFTKDWLPSEAYLQMLQAIDSSKGNIAAVVASNDGMAVGAIQALREHNLAGKVLVSGQDADLASVICIAQGVQTMTVYKPIPLQAARAADEAVHLATGGKPAADTTTGNGKINVPTILLKPVLVTKSNIQSTVVKDGFQTLKAINQGLSPDQQIH